MRFAILAVVASTVLVAVPARADTTVPDEARAEYEKGEIAREEGRLEEASEHYRKAISLFPLYMEAHSAHLAVQRGMGRASGVADLYANLVVQHPGSVELKVFHAAADTPESAVSNLTDLTNAHPENVRGWIELTRAHLLVGDPRKAERAVKEALKLESENIAARVLLGDCYLATDKLTSARKEYQSILDQAADNVPARLKMGLTLHRSKKSDEALDVLRRLVSEDNLPRLVAGHWLIASIRVAKGEFDEALKTLDLILSIDKGDHDALIVKGQVLLMAGKPMDAVKVFEEASKSRENSATALFCTGWAYETAADAPEIKDDARKARLIAASEAYDRCANLDPTVRPRDSLGFVYLLTEEMHREAITQFKRATDIDPKFAPALNNLGLASDMADNRSEAKKRYDHVLKKIDKENVRALVMLALDHWLDGSASKAIKLLNKALKLNPEDYLAWTFLGDVHYDNRRYPQAIRAYEEATQINDKFFYAWFHMGIAYDQDRKRDEEADQCYRKALECKVDPPPELALYLAYVNEKENLDRIEEAYKFYKLYIDLGGDVASVGYDWIPKRMEDIQKELEKKK